MHRKFLFLLFLIVVFIFALFTALNAQSLDVKLEGFGGLSGGSTDDPDKSGEVGFSGGGGIGVSLYLLQFGKIRLGASTGVDFMYLTYTSTTNTIPVPPTIPSVELKSDTNYSYLVVPVTVKCAYSLSDSFAAVFDAGPFFGFFLGGKSKNTYNPPVSGFLENGKEDLDKNTTEQLDIGLRLAASIELGINENLRLSPGVMFDLGFSDTSKDQLIVASSKDTFWKLDAYFAVIYNLF
ncbi:MAG: hypothetical protein AMS17_08415 [Spirochaetes bacterium DG_61]|nr:MAG: hypothetical protein AMS17_08415 [Spirochaetes bacterium DG_61]